MPLAEQTIRTQLAIRASIWFRPIVPKLIEAELEASIASGKIVSISLDTSIFDRYQCNLHYATLRKLEQFRTTHITVLISQIVAAEVQAHLERDAAKSQRDLKAALGTHAKRWRISTDETDPAATLMLDRDPADFAAQQFADYVEAVGAEIVPAARSLEVAQGVVQRYFDTATPFEASDKKKHEFPDAFALLSLEEAAAEQDRLILCVSADAGWQNFADASDHLVCVTDLDPVLDLFHEAGRTIAKRTLDLVRNGQAPLVQAGIDSAFEARLDENDFDISVSDAPTDYEAEPISAVLQDLDWSLGTPNVIAEDADSVTFTTSARALIEFTAHFEFYVRDGIDKDTIKIGSEEFSSKRWLQFDVALTVSRDMDEEPELFEAAVSRRGMTALFDRLEPFGREDPTHEKY